MVRHGFGTALPNHHPELGLEVECLVAGRAVVQVLLDVLALVVRELAVEILVELLEGLGAVRHRYGQRSSCGHPSVAPPGTTAAGSFGSFAASASPRETAWPYNRFCSAFLPRCNRLITVPIGM